MSLAQRRCNRVVSAPVSTIRTRSVPTITPFLLMPTGNSGAERPPTNARHRNFTSPPAWGSEEADHRRIWDLEHDWPLARRAAGNGGRDVGLSHGPLGGSSRTQDPRHVGVEHDPCPHRKASQKGVECVLSAPSVHGFHPPKIGSRFPDIRTYRKKNPYESRPSGSPALVPP